MNSHILAAVIDGVNGEGKGIAWMQLPHPVVQG